MTRNGVRLQTEPTLALVDAAGAPVALRPTVQRLLRVLHESGPHGATVETLVAGIWDGAPPSDPIGSLHTTVARLRRALPPDALRRVGDSYVLAMTSNAPARSAPDLPEPVVNRPWRLVGRDDLVASAIERAERGLGSVFHGGAGVGKSRIADEVVHRLARRGWPAAVLRARAGADDVPLGVFAPLLTGDLPASPLPMLVAARHAIDRRLDGRRWVLAVDAR